LSSTPPDQPGTGRDSDTTVAQDVPRGFWELLVGWFLRNKLVVFVLAGMLVALSPAGDTLLVPALFFFDHEHFLLPRRAQVNDMVFDLELVVALNIFSPFVEVCFECVFNLLFQLMFHLLHPLLVSLKRITNHLHRFHKLTARNRLVAVAVYGKGGKGLNVSHALTLP
jgi:hypothetical protein